MPGLLNGRVALITGDGGEIGGAIARRFASEAAAVAVADIGRAPSQAVAQDIAGAGGRALSIEANVALVSDAERSVHDTVAAFGSLTTLVHVAAAVTPDGTVESLTL